MSRLFFLLALSCTLFAQQEERQRMPYFNARTLSGEKADRDTLHGKPVLIQLWATWCGYCRRDEPIVEKLAEEFTDLQVLAVNVGEPRGKVLAYLKERPRKNVKVVGSEDSDLPSMVRPKGFPFYIVLDKDGKVAVVQPGSGGEAGLRDLLEQVGLKGQ